MTDDRAAATRILSHVVVASGNPGEIWFLLGADLGKML